MVDIHDEAFDALITEVMDELPKEYIERLNNVAITYADEPSEQQRIKLKLHCNQTLFGLYEGVPLTKRGSGYNLVLPDKITIFKNPLLSVSGNIFDLKQNTKHTLWHEIAHYYGLDHDRIHSLEKK